VIAVDNDLRELVQDDLRLGCGMHIRRKFELALKLGDTRAAKPLQLIGQIYATEAEAKEQGMSFTQWHALRQEKSIPILDELEK
jgi:hypothetical protein